MMMSFIGSAWYCSVWLLLVRSTWPLPPYFSLKKQPRAASRTNAWAGCAGRGRKGSDFWSEATLFGQCLGAQLRGLVIGAASGAAGRAYSALDDFMEFHRGGACLASFHAEA